MRRFDKFLEYIGFRQCADVWAENEKLKQQVEALQWNLNNKERLLRVRRQRLGDFDRALKDARVRIIELQQEVNDLLGPDFTRYTEAEKWRKK